MLRNMLCTGLSSGKAGTVAYALIQVCRLEPYIFLDHFEWTLTNLIILKIQIPVTMLGVVLMDKSGRRALLLVSSSGTFLGCFLAGTSFFFKVHSTSYFSPYINTLTLVCFKISKTDFRFMLFPNQDQAIFVEWVPLLAVSGVLIFIASFSIGMGAVPWLIMSEVTSKNLLSFKFATFC